MKRKIRTKKLIAGKDYSVGYSSNKAVCESKAMITIKFKGSYAGTEQKIFNFSIAKASLADDVEVSDISIIAPSKEQKPVPTIIMKSTGKKISKNNFKFSYKDAYSKDVTGVKEAGTYKVIIEPKEGSESFTGYAKAEITVDLSEYNEEGKDTYSFVHEKEDGTAFINLIDLLVRAQSAYLNGEAHIQVNGDALVDGANSYLFTNVFAENAAGLR